MSQATMLDTRPGERMLASLPAVFQERDSSGDLARLLGAFEALFFGGDDTDAAALPGIERCLQTIPALFAPLGTPADPETRTPEPFLHWLASWLAFTPHALFAPEALRRIVAGIVPLYGLRGSREYLLQLLRLCFDDIGHVEVDDRPRTGFTIGSSLIGRSTRLAEGRAFWFLVVIKLNDAPLPDAAHDGRAALERRLRAVIDFAKPAHTAYELRLLVPHLGAAPIAHGPD